MSDDIIPGGVLPVDDNTLDDEFDPDEVESDDFLDDADDLAVDTDVPKSLLDDDDDLFSADEI